VQEAIDLLTPSGKPSATPDKPEQA
jgi:hypothetical protein